MVRIDPIQSPCLNFRGARNCPQNSSFGPPHPDTIFPSGPLTPAGAPSALSFRNGISVRHTHPISDRAEVRAHETSAQRTVQVCFNGTGFFASSPIKADFEARE